MSLLVTAVQGEVRSGVQSDPVTAKGPIDPIMHGAGCGARTGLRASVGHLSFDAMLDAAKEGEDLAANVAMTSPDAARTAFELLVAQARIDGDISPNEREDLRRIAMHLGNKTDEFKSIYVKDVDRADALRKAKSLG